MHHGSEVQERGDERDISQVENIALRAVTCTLLYFPGFLSFWYWLLVSGTNADTLPHSSSRGWGRGLRRESQTAAWVCGDEQGRIKGLPGASARSQKHCSSIEPSSLTPCARANLLHFDAYSRLDVHLGLGGGSGGSGLGDAGRGGAGAAALAGHGRLSVA